MYEVISFENDRIKLLDQNALPESKNYIYIESVDELVKAIKELKIRGAPALGIAAAFGLKLVAIKNRDKDRDSFLKILEIEAKKIKESRPTAYNLFYAIDRILSKAKNASNPQEVVINEANEIYKENYEMDKRIAEIGSEVIEDGDVILTHCNTGKLATCGYLGTALGVIIEAYRKGKRFKVFATETRPLLQGARLTTFELCENNIKVTLIPDSAVGFIFKKYNVNKVFVGADRIARNGDTANKIGTYNIAIIAKHHNAKFYVVAPTTTIDINIKTGEEIPIEFRGREEIEFFNNKRIVDARADILNPAFDVTPNELITAIITEKGIIEKPFEENIMKLFK